MKNAPASYHRIPARLFGLFRFVFDRKVHLWILTVLVGSGCQSISYYRQAAIGQWQIEKNKRSIQNLRVDPSTHSVLKEKFETIHEIRRFAFWKLGLPAEDAYDSYVELKRDYVVWNVTACPEFSMEPHRWWYPLLGKLKYRGYFDEKSAKAYAKSMASEGYDVAVEGVVAYSTLGWFRDPVFDTFIDWPDRAIAELLFHELSHQKVFLTGKTEWNEAFAVVTAREGVREWLKAESRLDELEQYEAEIALEETFIELILDAKQKLEKLYQTLDENQTGSGPSASEELGHDEKWMLKQAVFEEFKNRFEKAKVQNPSLEVYSGWMSRPMNNARLASIDTYFQWVPMFEALKNQFKDDWTGYFEAVQSLDDDPSLIKH